MANPFKGNDKVDTEIKIGETNVQDNKDSIDSGSDRSDSDLRGPLDSGAGDSPDDASVNDPAEYPSENVPDEPVEEGEPVEEAVFVSETDPSTQTTPNDPIVPNVVVPDAEAGFAGATAKDRVGPAIVTEPSDPFDVEVKEAINEIHKMMVEVNKDIASLKVLAGEVGPLFESVIEETKERGLAGLLPLLLSGVRGK